MTKILAILFILMAYQISMAANISFTQNKLNLWAKSNKIVGAAVSIDNRKYYYGYTNKANSIKVDSKSVFGIGSITKLFISVAILDLEKDHKLNINDKVTKYLPQYEKLKNIKIRDLMNMTAGFNDISTKEKSTTPIKEIIIAYQHYEPKNFGTWLYSNVSYQLLGILIEKTTHATLKQNISKQILLPLKLSHTYFPNEKQAKSLLEYQNDKTNITDYQTEFAAGGLVSNTHDLYVFLKKLFISKSLLPTKQYKELTTFVKTPKSYYAFTKTGPPKFGLGVFKWNVSPFGTVLTYPGVLENGFASTFVIYRNKVIIAQTNTYNHNNFTVLWPYQNIIKTLINSR